MVKVTLEPLQLAHAAELWPAAEDPDMAAVWPISWNSLADVEAQFAKLIRQGEEGRSEPFLVRVDGEAAGSTSFYDMADRVVSIGWTFFVPKFRRTHVNTASKLWMLTRAFEELGCRRVQFDVDQRNVRSQTAVLRIGAKQEGILRKHKVLWDGFVRDTVVFSIIAEEWADVKAHLTTRLRTLQS